MTELDVPCMKIEDTYTGEIYDIVEGEALTFQLSDTTTLARFVLHLGKNYETSSESVLCHEDQNGSIQLDLGENMDVSYTIVNGETSIVGEGNGDPLIINNLASGTYHINVPDLENLCLVNDFTIVVGSVAPLESGVVVGHELLGNDGQISLNISGGTPPYIIEWSNGSSEATISGLTAGDYEVEILDQNGCMLDDSFQVVSMLGAESIQNSDFMIYYNSYDGQIELSGINSNGDLQVVIYSVDGAVIQRDEIYFDGNPSSINSIEINKELSKGVYLVKILGMTRKFVVK
jgi:hypothetical protein